MELHLLSWNLDGLNTRRLDARAEEACLEMVLGQSLREAVNGGIGRPPPQVIALQEVVKRIHLSTLRPHLIAAGYALSPAEPAREDGDYSVIAVREPWELGRGRRVRFGVSPLARHWVEVVIHHPTQGRARVITGHMESLRSGGEARLAQARELDALLGDPDAPPTVFLGDTNLRDSEWRAVRRDLAMDDAFELAGAPRAARATWWPPTNEEAPGFRFDRVWLDPGRPWTVSSFETRRRPRISDHAAIEVRVRAR